MERGVARTLSVKVCGYESGWVCGWVGGYVSGYVGGLI